jgi:HNH endonuclease
MSRILTLDQQGHPSGWVSHQDAITYHAKGLVAWQLGEGQGDTTFRGGENRITGQVSRITTAPIIAIKGKATASRRANKAPSLNNSNLFSRDDHVCAYCAKRFSFGDLTRDHVIPRSKGGRDIWTNVVTACGPCNHRKDDHLLEEVGMKLVYVPYTPNLAESLLLEGRNILACQMDYLVSFIPPQSRVLDRFKSH